MPHPAPRFFALICGAALLAASPAQAEQADRDKPINLEADTVDINDLTKVSVYQGNVRLTQGTMVLTANKLVVIQDDEGLSKSTATGGPAYFKQKREGLDENIEGWAQRIEYNAKTDVLDMYTQARVRRGDDEVRGNFITYNGQNETYRVVGGPEAATEYNPKGRVRAVIQPKPHNTPPKNEPALPLTPSPRVNVPE